MSTLLVQALINGLLLGCIYGLVATSLTLLYGTMRIVNLAHGDLVIVGSYIAVVLYQGAGIHPALAGIVAFALVGLFGTGLYRLVVARLQNAPNAEMTSFLAFYGLSLMITAVLLNIFGADTRYLGFSFRPVSVRLGPAVIPSARLVAVLIGILILAALAFFLFRTPTGKALRASIMNREALRIVGVNVDRLSMIAFGLSFGLAAAAGVLIAMIFPAFGPFSGIDFTMIAFIAIVLGGLGSPLGALAGGIIFGVVEQVATLYFSQALGMAAGFLMLIAVVSMRPHGLLGAPSWR